MQDNLIYGQCPKLNSQNMPYILKPRQYIRDSNALLAKYFSIFVSTAKELHAVKVQFKLFFTMLQ